MATTFAGGRLDWQLSEASAYVNLAYAEVASRIGHRSKESVQVSSTTSGGYRVAVPSDYDSLLAFTLYVPSTATITFDSVGVPRTWTTIPLQQVDVRSGDAAAGSPPPLDAFSATALPGVPDRYVPYANWLELVPSPNSAYSYALRYMAKNPTLVNSTDTPVLDERWHPAILYKSVELLEASRNNPEGEAIARNRYLNYVQGTPTDAALKQQDRTGMSARYARKLD